MPVRVFRDAELWLGAYDLTGSVNSVALGFGADLKESTVLGDVGRKRLAGIPDVALQVQGFWDPTLDGGFHTNVGLIDVPVTIAPVDGDEGSLAYAFPAALASKEHGGDVGEMFAFSVSAEASGGDPLVRGTLMANRSAEIVTANGTARQLGAVTASQKLYASLHVIAASAGDTLDVTIESDDASGFPSPTTRLTFAQKTALGSEWATPLAGAITDDWFRVRWVIGVASPSFDFVVMVGIQ